jgi:hypothetical protein
MRLLPFLVCALLFCIQPVLAPGAMAEHMGYNLCTDGRVNDGKPRSCSELNGICDALTGIIGENGNIIDQCVPFKPIPVRMAA